MSGKTPINGLEGSPLSFLQHLYTTEEGETRGDSETCKQQKGRKQAHYTVKSFLLCERTKFNRMDIRFKLYTARVALG